MQIFAQMDAPSKGLGVGDAITDVDEKGRLGAKTDKKIFSNALFVYGQIRQTAEGTINVLKGVADFALMAFGLLVRVENVVNTAVEIKKYWGEYGEIWRGKGNFFEKLDNSVTNTYENIICRGSDVMWLETSGAMNDLAEMDKQRQRIARESRNIGALWNIEKDTVQKKDSVAVSDFKRNADGTFFFDSEGYPVMDTSYDSYEIKEIYLARKPGNPSYDSLKNAQTRFQKNMREQSYMASQAVNMTDKRLIDKYKFDPRAKRAAAKSETMSDAIANVNVRKQQHEDNYWELRYAMGMVSEGSGDTSSITAQAQGEVLAAENDLKTTFSEHESLNDLIKVMGAMTLSNVGYLSSGIVFKSTQIQTANEWADICRKKAKEFPVVLEEE
jgi:hypothetical protein